MSWRYMAARETAGGEEVWTIREVYETSDGTSDGTSWTASEVAPTGSTHDELREALRMMTFDIEQHRDYLDLDAGVVAHRPYLSRTPEARRETDR